MKKLWDSRIDSTRKLVEWINEWENPPIFLCASAVGVYGEGFLHDLATAWEGEANKVRARVVNMRFGVVLHPSGGALSQMLSVFRKGFGAPLGSGKQIMSWIALEDLCSAIALLMEDATLEGPVNMVSPNPISNQEISIELARWADRMLLPRVPRFVLLILMGKMADQLLLNSINVRPDKLLSKNFNFEKPTISAVLAGLK